MQGYLNKKRKKIRVLFFSLEVDCGWYWRWIVVGNSHSQTCMQLLIDYGGINGYNLIKFTYDMFPAWYAENRMTNLHTWIDDKSL
jgi:hypothetical protein